MPKAQFQADRYHMTMANFSLSEHAKFGVELLANLPSTFYAAFRKLPFAPCVGHERLVENLTHISIDPPRIRFLKNDRAGLGCIAEHLENRKLFATVRAVRPGTVIFPNEPFADISGPFVTTQLTEVKFEHAFDIPMTVASRALQMRMAAGERWLSDFSLRRNGEIERSVDVARYAYIGGFNDTSNMEAGFLLDQFPVGTMAHYLVQSYVGVKENDPVTGLPKHFEQICFERWLDAHPNGTTLLVDTISIPFGIKHAIAAAKSSESRRKAFRAVRIDTQPLASWSAYVQSALDLNGFSEVKILTSGDHDEESIAEVVREHPRAFGFGVGTKLLSEVPNVAGVIFKESLIRGYPTLKCSSKGKATLPGKLQILRYKDKDDYYVGDVIMGVESPTDLDALVNDTLCPWKEAESHEELLKDFWDDGSYDSIPSMEEQREYVRDQVKRFRDIRAYPVILSPGLKDLVEKLTAYMNKDENEYRDLVIPEGLKEPEDGKK